MLCISRNSCRWLEMCRYLFSMTNAFCISAAKAVLLCMWKTFKCHFLHTSNLHVLISILVLQVWIMHQFFLNQCIFLWNWVFVALSNDAMSNLHFFVPCHSTTYEIVAGWLLLLLSKGLWKNARDSMLQVHLYLLQWPVCSNLETTSQTQLNFYLIFHNTCNRSCATWLSAHLMLACSGHSSTAFGEEIPQTTWDHFVLSIRNEQQWVKSSSCLPCSHIPLELWFWCPAPASTFSPF